MNLFTNPIVIEIDYTRKEEASLDNRELFTIYRQDVYRTCYYMVHDAADAEDLCQEVFITVFRSPWEQVEHIKAWMMKITVNHCLNHLRRRRSLQHKVAEHPHMFTGHEEKAVERLVEERESAEEWAAYMKRLPVKLRAVLTLRYMHDFSLAEISDLLEIPVGTAKSRLHRGLGMMRAILKEAGVQREDKEAERYEKDGRSAKAAIK